MVSKCPRIEIEIWGRVILCAGWKAAQSFRQVSKEFQTFIDSRGDDFYAQMWISCGYHDEFYPEQRPFYTVMESNWKNGDHWPEGKYAEIKRGDDLTDRGHITKTSNRDITDSFISASLLYNDMPFPPSQPKHWISWREKNEWRDIRKQCCNETCQKLIPPSLLVTSFPLSNVRVNAAGKTIDDAMVLVEAGFPEKRLVGLVRTLMLDGDYCFFCCRPGHWTVDSGETAPIVSEKMQSSIDEGN